MTCNNWALILYHDYPYLTCLKLHTERSNTLFSSQQFLTTWWGERNLAKHLALGHAHERHVSPPEANETPSSAQLTRIGSRTKKMAGLLSNGNVCLCSNFTRVGLTSPQMVYLLKTMHCMCYQKHDYICHAACQLVTKTDMRLASLLTFMLFCGVYF